MMAYEGYPEVRYYWTNNVYNAMVMELLGESLDDLHRRAHRRFSIVTVILIAIQTLKRIESLHKEGFVCMFLFYLVFFLIQLSPDPPRYQTREFSDWSWLQNGLYLSD